MRRRDFLQWTALGGAALGLAPALAADAFTAGPDPTLIGDRFRLTVLGLENAEHARDVCLELAHPVRDVVLWAHRGGSVPSTGRVVTQTVSGNADAGLTFFVTSNGTRRPVTFRNLRRGTYRIAIDRHTQLLFGVEDPRNV